MFGVPDGGPGEVGLQAWHGRSADGWSPLPLPAGGCHWVANAAVSMPACSAAPSCTVIAVPPPSLPLSSRWLLPGSGLRARLLTRSTAAGAAGNWSHVDVLLANPLRLEHLLRDGKVDLKQTRWVGEEGYGGWVFRRGGTGAGLC